ncbi:MAG: EAL domain-containing protein [Oscillospiraceae bacterium]|nr:EAL domain-containing protein [Oscillospiraceae bacterium]
MDISIWENSIARLLELAESDMSDEEGAGKVVSSAIADAAELLNIGRLTAALDASEVIGEIEGNHSVSVLYDNNSWTDEGAVMKQYASSEYSRSCMCANPVKGCSWNDDERRLVGVLCNAIYLLCGRSRLTWLIQKVMVTDHITGVLNSTGIIKFGNALAEKGQLSEYTVVFMNIKNFKYINKTAGSRMADVILRKFAHSLVEFNGGSGAVSRLGGDNFLLLLKNDMVERFCGYMKKLALSADGKLYFDIRVVAGFYLIAENDNMNTAMDKVTAAYDAAKRSERDDFLIYKPEMLDKAVREKEVSQLFPSALENKEFVVYYQPKVCLDNNSLCGCEALSRWMRNGRIVPPMDFIPVLEREGSICELDFYVLETICADIKKWQDMGIDPVRVSTNFSKMHLHNKTLAERIVSVINKYGIDTRFIEIELTEMTGYEDYDALAAFVAEMKAYGIHTSIDDFGTGYSSLNLLKELDVDIIKLDRSFFNNIAVNDDENSHDRIVIKNIVNMVKELNMEVIAEGIETCGQVEFLKDIRCCMVQGYLYDRPLPQEQFLDRLMGHRIYV